MSSNIRKYPKVHVRYSEIVIPLRRCLNPISYRLLRNSVWICITISLYDSSSRYGITIEPYCNYRLIIQWIFRCRSFWSQHQQQRLYRYNLEPYVAHWISKWASSLNKKSFGNDNSIMIDTDKRIKSESWISWILIPWWRKEPGH